MAQTSKLIYVSQKSIPHGVQSVVRVALDIRFHQRRVEREKWQATPLRRNRIASAMDPDCFFDRSRAFCYRYYLPTPYQPPQCSYLPGLIKSPVSTTALQVVTRVIQVWMVWYSFPISTASSSAYLALLLAWSAADTLRYLYLAANLWNKAPGWLVWVRYVYQHDNRPEITLMEEQIYDVLSTLSNRYWCRMVVAIQGD